MKQLKPWPLAEIMSLRAITLLSVLCSIAAHPVSAADAELLEEALSAAPPTLRDEVTVMDWDKNVLQQGSSDYTCFPTPPQFKGTAPMCMDATWMEWADAWANKKPFEAKSLGISYMLAGDAGASNIDPYAQEETPDNQWIKEGPHLMLITPDQALLESLPDDPYGGGPYVMWKGTPYAHIMVPIGERE